MKKKTSFILTGIILVFVAIFLHPYRVKNVFDEIGLTGRSVFFIPCTETNFYNFNADFVEKDTVAYLDFRIGFIYDCDGEWSCNCYADQNQMYVYIINNSLDSGSLSLEIKYFFASKKSKERLLVYRQSGLEERGELAQRDVAELFSKKGSSIEAVYEEAMNALEKMFDAWILSNEGKSKFSVGDYGKYSKGKLAFYGNIS